MTLKSAPPLTTLASLTHEWRHVATLEEPGKWRWHGDLAISEILRVYQVMRDTHGTLVQATYRAHDGETKIFAAIASKAQPMASYDVAVAYLGGAAVRAAQAQAMRAAAATRKRTTFVA